MPEEKRDEYQVIAYRHDLVTITAEEYRDLIIASIENKALAEKRLSDWCNELDKVKRLSAQVEALKAEADGLRVQVEQLKAKSANTEVGHYA